MKKHQTRTVGLLAIVAGVAALSISSPMHAQLSDYAELSTWYDVQQRIDQGIERNRKGDAAIQVVGEDGRPIVGAALDIQQKTHEFLFGCNAFVLGQYNTAEKNRKYEEAFAKLFNFATVPFFWEGTEPAIGYIRRPDIPTQPADVFWPQTNVWRGELRYQEGSREIWRRPPTDRFIPFAKKYGITLKGHPLLWWAYNPPWLPSDPAELKRLYQERFRQIAERYSKDIKVWDVVNESLGCLEDYPLFTPGREYVAWAFNEASQLFRSENVLMINEAPNPSHAGVGENSAYYRQVKQLLGQGVNIEGIGFQFHLLQDTRNPQRPAELLDIYESFMDLGRPLYITEITVPGADKEGGRSHQAEVIVNLYRLWFSVAGMEGITYWNLPDGTNAQPEYNALKEGLVDEDLNPKAAYQALDKLINYDWKTNLSSKTDAAGKAQFRGFYGKYAVKVVSGNLTKEFEIDLSKNGNAVYKLILKP